MTADAEGDMTAGDRVPAGLDVDADLLELMRDVLAAHAGPGAEPDPAAVWRSLTQVGLAGLTAPERSGGSGAGWAEAAALLRAAATAGVAVPYAETDLVAGPLCRAAGLDDRVSGTSTLAVLGPDGRAGRVAWAGATDSVLVVRRVPVPGGDTRVAGVPRYEVARAPTPQVTVEPVAGISAAPLGHVTPPAGLDWVPVAASAVEDAVTCGALARAVQCVGAAEGMLDSAVGHTTTRQQFGRPLARFQSVQNLVVDIAAETVLARAAVDRAVADVVAGGPAGPLVGFRVAVARSVAAHAVGVAVRAVHQVHGAIGTTHEHPLHRLTLPALQWRGEFGSAAFWESALAEAVVGAGGDGAWPLIAEGAPVRGAGAWLDRVTGG